MEEEKKEKRNPFLRFLAFLVTLALVLGAVFLVANWQKLNFDAVKRYFTYRSLVKNESGQAESYSYDGGISSSFARLGDDLLVCSASGIRLYSASGAAYVDQTCHLDHPVVSVGGNAALVYDAGGTDLYVYANRELVFSLTVENDYSILSASLSAQGQLTVVTQASGLKGAVTVYDAAYQPVLGVNLSSRFITDAILSPDGKTLALATAGQTGGVYDSQIAFYSLSRTTDDREPDKICSLGNNAVLKLSWPSQPLRVLGENALCYVSADGTLTGSYSYGGRYLKGYSLDADGFAALLLGKYRAGSSADLVTVDLTGQEAAARSFDYQILSLSAAGRYLSVLTADGLTIYTQDLTPYHTLEGGQGARKVLQRPDGSVMLIAGETSRLYLPD